MAEFLMPKLGTDMQEGILVEWLKKPCDAVHRGDLIAEVETDKGTIQVECFTSGVLQQILVPEGSTVPVGTILAIIKEEGAPPEAIRQPVVAASAAGQTAAAKPLEAPPLAPTVKPSTVGQRALMSPAARKRARELGVDPESIHGTGRGGAISLEDVEKAAAAKAAVSTAPPATTTASVSEPAARMARIRQAIAAAMSRSKREIPHYYLSTSIDMHSALTWLAEKNAALPVSDRILYATLLIKAVALALRETPELNALWDGQQGVIAKDIHIGVAVSLRQGGLIAPAIHHVDRLSLEELMVKLRDLVQRTRTGALRASEMTDPTFTVTNLGEQGVESVYGIINPPQVAIAGFGSIVQRPWIVDGQIVPRPIITATLAADHRVSDGHRGGLFLRALNRWLQEPAKL